MTFLMTRAVLLGHERANHGYLGWAEAWSEQIAAGIEVSAGEKWRQERLVTKWHRRFR